MEVVLLEKVGRFGKMGDIVKVKDGFARNYLIPQHKALRATKENIAQFEARRAELEKLNNERKADASALAAKIEKVKLTLIRQAGEDGRLYGSVAARDIVDALKEKEGIEVDKKFVHLDFTIKNAGEYKVKMHLHSEVTTELKMVVAGSEAHEETLAAADERKSAERAAAAPAGEEKPRRARKPKAKKEGDEEEN